MEDKEVFFEKMRQAILSYDVEAAKIAAQEALKAHIDPLEAIEKGLKEGLKILGDKFGRGEIFLPHLVIATNAVEAATNIFKPAISSENRGELKLGVIVFGTVKDDLHDLGKNIVVSLLRANGFEVHDLGKDVSVEKFIEAAESFKSDIIAASALMTNTRYQQQELIEELKRRGLSDKFKVMVGGGAVTQAWADTIGADDFAKDAIDAVKVAKRLMETKAS
jgi:corrinoid protein of di/trimethylamine methyltransferase